jgi:chain length determinant protein EpsF
MSFAKLLAVLKVRKWLVLLIMGLTVGTAVLISISFPKQYDAEATIVVDMKPDPITGQMMPGYMAAGYLATQMDIIRSDRVALRVVKNLGLARDENLRNNWRESTGGAGMFESWIASGLLNRLVVLKGARDASVIQLSYRSTSPEHAAAVVNGFVQAYLDTAVELRVAPARQSNVLFAARAKELREAVEVAQAKVSAYQREKGILVNDERVDVETARLSELSSQLVVLQGISADSQSRLSQAGGASADRLQEVLNNPAISGLKADVGRAQARLTELNSRLGDAHPQVVEAKASLAELRSRLDVETRRVTGGVGVTNAINRQREAEIKAALEAQRARVLRLKGLRDEAAVLQRDVENAQRAYDAIINRVSETGLESRANQINAYGLSDAVPPTKPSFPNIPLNGALGFFVGSILAVGVALVLEAMDRRVRVVSDITSALGLPVVGVVPRAKPGSGILGGHRPALQHSARVELLPLGERSA